MYKWILTSLLPLFFHAAFAQNVVIGAPMAMFSDKWSSYLIDAIQQFDEENDEVEILFTDANGDPSRMLNDVETLLNNNVDALLVQPTDRATVKPIAIKAEKAGIPLIVVNRFPNEEDMDKVTAYVGSESIQAGLLQAEEVIKQADGKPTKVILIMGQQGHEAQVKRTEGNDEIFSQHDNITIIDRFYATWDRAKAMQNMEDILQTHQPDAIVSNNDEMAIGAYLAAEKAGYSNDDLIIAGIDATPDALEYLGNGLDVTVFQSAKDQGRTAAEVAVKAARGEAVEKYYWVDFELVTPDKKEEYIQKYQ